MSVSLALLTWNRASVFVKTMDVSLQNSGIQFDEICWVDNGSDWSQYAIMDEFIGQFPNLIRIRFPINTGMARGINSAMANCRSDYVLFSGPDIIFPDNWAKTFVDYMENLPNSGIVAIWNAKPEQVPERLRGPIEVINGRPVLKALPFDTWMIRRNLFQKVGYLREDFGLYGWSDVEWLERCEAILPKLGLNCYVIPHLIGNHLHMEGAEEFRKGIDEDYQSWKDKQTNIEEHRNLVLKCQREGNPYYSPF